MQPVERPRYRLNLEQDGQPVSLLEAVRHVADGGDPEAFTAALEQCSEESKPQVSPGLASSEGELPC